VTGPRMRVCYSGCRWNSVVFSTDETTKDFEDWTRALGEFVATTVRENAGEFKVRRLDDVKAVSAVTPASNPDLYPPEIRCRLATTGRGDEAYSVAALFDESTGMEMEASEVAAQGYMTPVLRVGYYKDGDSFGLQFTVLKGEYERPVMSSTNHHAWIMDNGGEN